MLDIIAAIFATAAYTTVVGALVGLSPVGAGKRLAPFAAAAAWLAIIIAVAAFGWLTPGMLGPVPAYLLPFSELLMLLFGSWFLIPQFRDALLAVPLPVLVVLNAVRLGGVFFLLLCADRRLSAPFAPSATGAFALPLAAMLAFGLNVRRPWLSLWNAFGALDLVVAVFTWRALRTWDVVPGLHRGTGQAGDDHCAVGLRPGDARSDLPPGPFHDRG